MFPRIYLFAFALWWTFNCFNQQQCPDNTWIPSSSIPNKCYLVVRLKESWTNAEKHCQNVSSVGHLTSCTSAFENAELTAAIENSAWVHHLDQFWIGANDRTNHGTYQWSDQTPLTYTNWDKGQPSSASHCVSLRLSANGKWWTQPCTDTSYFVCETFQTSPTSTPPTKTTIVSTSSTFPSSTSSTTRSTSNISSSPSSVSTTMVGTATTTARTPTTSSFSTNMTDCFDWLHIGGQTSSGVYKINPGGVPPFDVYCDMQTDGGGWTLIQRRQDNSTIFWNQPWQQYKTGFNNVADRNFWLGLDRVNVLSNKDINVAMRIDLTKNRCPADTCGNSFDQNGSWFGVWKFSIDSEANKYQLHIGTAVNGTLSSSDAYDPFFSYNNNQPFTTIDNDNDNWEGGNCASSDNYKFGGWWHNSCGKVCLNGAYDPPQWGTSGISYYRSHFAADYYIVPVLSEMKLRKY